MREFLTRSTIWLNIAAYTVGVVLFSLRGHRPSLDSTTRALWTIAVIALGAHFVSAYHFYHSWSHAAAYTETARQTAEVFRINWGGGLFINYALLSIWTIDVSLWWANGIESYRRRTPWSLVMTWHSILIFILFNATVVFKTGAVRWTGLLICLTLIYAWLSINRNRTAALSVSQ